ncbi:MAG: DUF1700 domain-containing protein [Aristaeellaceae bacterium]
MNKKEFLRVLSRSLRGLPRAERAQSLEYYGEMIQDRMEEGLSEEEAVARLGSADEIARQILESSGVQEKRRSRTPVWMIALIVLGSPLWLTLLFAFLAVVLAAYIVAWSLIAALYAVLLGMAVCGPCGLLGFAVGLFKGNLAQAVLLLGGGCALLGAALLVLPWLNRAAIAVARASAWCARKILYMFRRGKV